MLFLTPGIYLILFSVKWMRKIDSREPPRRQTFSHMIPKIKTFIIDNIRVWSRTCWWCWLGRRRKWGSRSASPRLRSGCPARTAASTKTRKIEGPISYIFILIHLKYILWLIQEILWFRFICDFKIFYLKY